MNDLVAGEKYSVRVSAVNNKAESQNSPVIEQTMCEYFVEPQLSY